MPHNDYQTKFCNAQYGDGPKQNGDDSDTLNHHPESQHNNFNSEPRQCCHEHSESQHKYHHPESQQCCREHPEPQQCRQPEFHDGEQCQRQQGASAEAAERDGQQLGLPEHVRDSVQRFPGTPDTAYPGGGNGCRA